MNRIANRCLWLFGSWIIVGLVVACTPVASEESSSGGADDTGRSITIVQGPEPVSLDPSIDINKTSINVQHTMFDPLVYHTPENETIPWLATSWEAIEPTRWRIKLREDVTTDCGLQEDSNGRRVSLIDPAKTFVPLMSNIPEALETPSRYQGMFRPPRK